MKKRSLITIFLLLSNVALFAEHNETQSADSNSTKVDHNQSTQADATKVIKTKTDASKKSDELKNSELKKQIEEQMKREEKYAKEQVFYQGADYDLSSSEVNSKSLDKLKLIEPDFDFEMDDVYRDDL